MNTNLTAVNISNYLSQILDPKKMPDYGINGLQVDRTGAITKVALGVDISLELIERAVSTNCDLIITHHGLFWGEPLAVVGSHYTRIKKLIDNNIGLISFHLPLDAHEEFGNNSVILRNLGLNELIPFGQYKGYNIGWASRSREPLDIEFIKQRLGLIDESKCRVFGRNRGPFHLIAAVSGGGGNHYDDAVSLNCDLFITGEFSHKLYHPAIETSTSILFGGHYQTETFGIKSLGVHISQKFGIETLFFDIPTTI